MKISKEFSGILTSMALLAACTESSPADLEAKVRTATAQALPELTMDSADIRGIERSTAKTRWEVHSGVDRYVCDADQLMRLPSCTRM